MARWRWFGLEERIKSSRARLLKQKKKKWKEEKKNRKEEVKPHQDSDVRRVQMRLGADAPSHRVGAGLWSIWAEVTFSRRPRWEERPPPCGLAFSSQWIHRLCPQWLAQYTAATLKLRPYWAWRHCCPKPLSPCSLPQPPPPPFKRAPVELQSAPPSLWRVLCIQTKIRERPAVLPGAFALEIIPRFCFIYSTLDPKC